MRQWSELIAQLNFLKSNEQGTLSESALHIIEEMQQKLEVQKKTLEDRFREPTETNELSEQSNAHSLPPEQLKGESDAENNSLIQVIEHENQQNEEEEEKKTIEEENKSRANEQNVNSQENAASKISSGKKKELLIDTEAINSEHNGEENEGGRITTLTSGSSPRLWNLDISNLRTVIGSERKVRETLNTSK